MAKTQHAKKTSKKAPQKTLKEKRAAKKAKQASKADLAKGPGLDLEP